MVDAAAGSNPLLGKELPVAIVQHPHDESNISPERSRIKDKPLYHPTGWFRLYPSIINDIHIQRLDGEEFREKFLAALEGHQNEISAYVGRGIIDRLPPPLWRKRRMQVFERDDFTCVYCHEDQGPLECDHIIPLSKGGTNDIENLATACFRCNRSKAGKLLHEWIASLDGGDDAWAVTKWDG